MYTKDQQETTRVKNRFTHMACVPCKLNVRVHVYVKYTYLCLYYVSVALPI